MKTKEEFLKEAYEKYYGSPKWEESVAKHNSEWVHSALTEYAKQQSIAFAVYLGGIMNGSVRARISVVGTTHFDDLYAQFIESQSPNK